MEKVKVYTGKALKELFSVSDTRSVDIYANLTDVDDAKYYLISDVDYHLQKATIQEAVIEGGIVAEELRKLMHPYINRLDKLTDEYEEAKESDDDELMVISELLQRQCRIMIAELWKVMVKVGALDAEEIEFGSIKKVQ